MNVDLHLFDKSYAPALQMNFPCYTEIITLYLQDL